MAKAKPTFGKRFAEWREAAGVTQDQVAAAARERGLSWTSSTVASIEIGRRGVSLAEFATMRGRAVERDELLDFFNRAAVAGRATDMQSAARLDAETKAARRLKVDPKIIVKLSHDLWGHSLTQERERLVAARLKMQRAAEEYWRGKGVSEPTVGVQSIRGHATRELFGKLSEALKRR